MIRFRLQLWSPGQGQTHPKYTLVCEQRIQNPKSVPTQVLYEVRITFKKIIYFELSDVKFSTLWHVA